MSFEIAYIITVLEMFYAHLLQLFHISSVTGTYYIQKYLSIVCTVFDPVCIVCSVYPV